MERKRIDNEEFARICEEEAAAGHTVVTGKEADLMPCISLWQPWAQFIALGWKTIETRTHKRFASLVGKRIAIHASRRWDHSWRVYAKSFMRFEWIEEVSTMERRDGEILCTALVEAHRFLCTPTESELALINCHGNIPRYGLILQDVRLPSGARQFIKGKQGIFYIPASLCA